MNGITRRGVVAALASPALPAFAQGDDWPSRPVTVISPYPPGGGSDIIARAVARALSEALGQPFVVDNRSGAAGSLGAAQVARARPDGYTMLVGGSSPIAGNKLIYRNLPYDPERDFTPLSLVAEAPLMIIAHPRLPVRTLPELIAYVRARPGAVACANAGTGSKGHLAILMLCNQTGMELNHVPYRGTGPAQTDLLAGTVELGIDTASVYVPHVRRGALHGIAVTSTRRMAQLPEVPTVAEQGQPGYEATVWYGAVAPAGIPAAIPPRIAAVVDAWGRSDAGRTMLTELGMAAIGGTPEDLGRAVSRELTIWRPVVEAAQMTLD
ncbi:Bug family tripartite tricarboxylate transporter substrate binding protein [Muricoccus radiodurans]|uniref:Bug family tripartite tricarboxylate transporter substrate binding protein n=1 Tax=Muricoccus radiodurans TaxID=2231721 RepID=UPI003CEF9067